MKKKVLAGIMTTAMIMAMITQAFRFAYEPFVALCKPCFKTASVGLS